MDRPSFRRGLSPPNIQRWAERYAILARQYLWFRQEEDIKPQHHLILLGANQMNNFLPQEAHGLNKERDCKIKQVDAVVSGKQLRNGAWQDVDCSHSLLDSNQQEGEG